MVDLKSEIVIELGCPTVDGIPCTCELCQRLFWRHANSILTLIRAKVDEIKNPYDFYSKREYEVGQYLAFKGGIEAAKEALK